MASQPPTEAPEPTQPGSPSPTPQEMPPVGPDIDVPDTGAPSTDPTPIQPN